MITSHLLPIGSTQLEKRAAEILKSAVENPIIIADLINPDRCPVELLPYLAWAFSVDKWDEHWAEEVPESGLNEQTYNELVRLVNDVKPVSRHLIQLAIAISPTGSLNTFVGQQEGEIITIYPQG